MNVTPNIHNVIVVGAIAVLFILLLRVASKTMLGNVPVLGSVLKTGATA